MSRYSKSIKGDLEIVWGYDPPLEEFFFQLHNMDTRSNGDEECVYAISNVFTMKPHPKYPEKLHYSNTELLDIMFEYEEHIPGKHILHISLGLPF